jgi:hypothetical protein
VAEEAEPEPPRVPEEPLRTDTPTFFGPDLFNPPPQQGWLTLTPSFTLSGEYNDNIFLSDGNEESDVSLGLTPGLTLSMRRRGYSLAAGYNTSGVVYFDNTDLSDFGKRQQFFGDFSYQFTPRLTFTVSDRFVYGESSNTVTSSGVSVGRQDSWRNTLVPSLRWQATPTTGFRLLASHSILRFEEGDSDSDTYRVGLEADHRLTPRLTGTLGMNVAYFDFEEEPSAWTFSPTIGLSYAITPTLRASVRGGPSFFERDGESAVTPSVGVSLTQAFKFGSLALGYDRNVTAEPVGVSDRQAIFGSLVAPTLARGLQLSLLPIYSIVDRDVVDTDISVKTLTVSLRATYQIARNISLIGSYTFYRQEIDGSDIDSSDVDQNRIFLGVQYAFPINFY